MDYKQITKETEKILNNQIIDSSDIDIQDISYKRVYKGWVTAISVDIRDFTNICKTKSPEIVTKIIQSFSTAHPFWYQYIHIC